MSEWDAFQQSAGLLLMASAPDRHGMSPDDFRLLCFYRDEVKHEFNLLAMRSTILVTCQSFLVVPFAILNTAPRFHVVAAPAVAVAILGMYTTRLIKVPIVRAHESISGWLLKQRQLLRGIESDRYKSKRDSADGVDLKTENDKAHEESVAFSRAAPNAFLVFWASAIVWTAIRLAWDLLEK